MILHRQNTPEHGVPEGRQGRPGARPFFSHLLSGVGMTSHRCFSSACFRIATNSG
jgi:hypothetical protein